MRTKPVDEQYFTWLYGQVAPVDRTNPSETHWGLLKFLFCKEFIWIIPNDDNRAEDGKELRNEFCGTEKVSASPEWMDLPCSILELFIGLSRHMAFQAEGDVEFWFWRLLENLDIHLYDDTAELDESRLNKILDDFNFRTYKTNGTGGIFPLRHPDENQRDVELWYQMSAYVLEQVR